MKPWYEVVSPREELLKDKDPNESEFEIHLDRVRDNRAAAVYQDPAAFFERTFMTAGLQDLAVQSVRRLSGNKAAPAVFSLATPSGDGKSHALTLLYHLVTSGNAAKNWKGMERILREAGAMNVPQAAVAVFVGSEFDSLLGRGGADGTPNRCTPWGDIAFQISGNKGLQLVLKHEQDLSAPGRDLISKSIPRDRPALILMDEVINYVRRNRKGGLAKQFSVFLASLVEVAHSRDNLVLAVSIPGSGAEMSAEDQAALEWIKNLLEKQGKGAAISAEAEISEVARRRLFKWDVLPAEAIKTIEEYEAWIAANRNQLPGWFLPNKAGEAFRASYPFHPSLFYLFDREWRELPGFRGMRAFLRLLALWVAKAYRAGRRQAHADPIISIGTAPLGDRVFRTAIVDLIGEPRLETVITTDIAGKDSANALTLDQGAVEKVKKTRLHQKAAIAILFESFGGRAAGDVALPDLRLAVAEPDQEIGSLELRLEALVDTCFYLTVEHNRYRFGLQPNLNELMADRQMLISNTAVEERVRSEIRKMFAAGGGLERVYFPRRSEDIPDRPALALAILLPESSTFDATVNDLIVSMTAKCGPAPRNFQSALIWCAGENSAALLNIARKLLAWKDLQEDAARLNLDANRRRQLEQNIQRVEGDLQVAVRRAYQRVFLLAENNELRKIDLRIARSSDTEPLVEIILTRLKQENVVVDNVNPNLLTRYWPAETVEWSTRAVRDAFYSSPRFPRLSNPEAVKEAISRGLGGGIIAYVGKYEDGPYEPFVFRNFLPAGDIEIGDDVYIISKERADAYLAEIASPAVSQDSSSAARGASVGKSLSALAVGVPEADGRVSELPPGVAIAGLDWTGEIPAKTWLNFYNRVLSRFAAGGGLTLTVMMEVTPPGGLTISKVNEIKAALKQLGMPDDLTLRTKEDK